MSIAEKHEVLKRLDTDLPFDVKTGSGVYAYWVNELFRQMWKEFRPGFSKVLPKAYDPFDQNEIIKKFNLKGFEYGNWLNQEDRYNYILATEIALFDLQEILRFGYDLGLNKTIGIAFGARGKKGALAHFEPHTFMINLTRFPEAKKIRNPLTGKPVFGTKTTAQVKETLFLNSGGVGSLCHEYGHALDYFFGTYIEQDTRNKLYRSLTEGRSISQRPDTSFPITSMRYDVSRIIEKMIWQKPGLHTSFYAALRDGVKRKVISDYWIRHNEMFARAFEVYISYKLNEKGIKNTFLTKTKYEGKWQYPAGNTFKSIVPHFDSLIIKMRKKL